MFEIEKTGKMNVPGLVIATKELMQEVDFERPLEQVKNVATLPGIVGYSIAMPDVHWGYGFPIGGVAATRFQDGVISPGGVGYDINCGIRLAAVPIKMKELDEITKQKLLQSIFEKVPSGIGKSHTKEHKLSDTDYKALAEQGAKWSIEQGYGLEVDLEHMESRGKIEGADMKYVSDLAKKRGAAQLGTIGSGNHFLEIGEIEEIFLKDVANTWGIQKGDLYLLIHSGSRGFGHQICQDTLHQFIQEGYGEDLVDPQLVAAPIQSPCGQAYFQAMAAAANFAFNNRQRILHSVRKAFKQVCHLEEEKVRLIYDVCHNIAKFETYSIDGKEEKLCVHRKGATRAFGPGAKELAPIFQQTGQPVLVPGDMMRASHLMVGLGNALTWCSCCHGAGRSKSRHQSTKSWQGKDLIRHMKQKGVNVMASSHRTIAEEMYDAYKDVDAVVDAVQLAKLANKVARLKPSLVIKG